MSGKKSLQLQYGINMHTEHIYKDYQPLQMTASYPDPQSSELRQKLAEYTETSKEMIVCGNGSDELIDLYIRMHAMNDKKFTVAVAPPTYFQYTVYTERAGVKTILLPHDRSLITPELITELGGDPKHTAIMLDNPSNPAGDITSRAQIIALLDAGYNVFADEAYYEFCHETVIDLLPKYKDNLVVSRTMSKIGAMAGSRAGYVVADPSIIADFNKYKPFFNFSIEAQHRGLFVLEHMPEFEQAIQLLKTSKTYTLNAIKKLKKYEVFPSLDLFVIFKHHHIPSRELHARLRRDFNIETYLFEDFKGHSVIRSATAQQPAMERLVSAMAELA